MNVFLKKLDEIRLEIKLSSSKELLSFEEAVLMLGISESYLYKLTSQKLIPHFKPFGKMIFFKRSELMAWIEKGRIQTQEEILNAHTCAAPYFKGKRASKPETSKSHD